MAFMKKKGVTTVKTKEVKIKKKNMLPRTTMFNVVIAVLMLAAFLLLMITLGKYKKTVKVVSLKDEVGNSIITEQEIKAKEISERDFDAEMILWDNRKEEAIDKYPTMQIRRETPVFKDMLTGEQVVKYAYLYELKPDEELITFKYDNATAGGRIPVPGDKFRIRGSYKMSDEEKTSYQSTGTPISNASNGTNVVNAAGEVKIKSAAGQDYIIGDIRTALIFDVVTVVDMLNNDGDSIYEIIKEVNSLPKAERDKMKSENSYKQLVTPTSMLIVIKSEQASKYTEFQAASNAAYTISLLSRDESLKEEDIKIGDSILDGVGAGATGGTTTTPQN